jgi:hypothetical protein
LNIEITPRVPAGFIEARNLEVVDRVRRAYEARVDEMRPYLDSLNYSLFPDSSPRGMDPIRQACVTAGLK